MSGLPALVAYPPEEQMAIRAKCFHPSGSFIEFKKEEIEQSIPDRFEQIVRRYPDSMAVKTKHYELTYDALNRMANRLAQAILAQCGEGNEPIALLFENDAPMVAAILGVLKTGRIYVPLDPSYPPARISTILEDSQADLIVTNTYNLPLARQLIQGRLQWINTDEFDSSLSTENPGLSMSPDILAWILYTSGSTGQPKGVVQNHRNVLSHIMAYTNNINICPDDRLTLLHSYSFSASQLNFFGALLNGAALFPFNLKWEGVERVGNWLMQEGISIYHSVPTVFRHFVSSLTGEVEFPQLRLIHLSGALVTRRDLELYKKHFSTESIFLHRIGATETQTIRWYFIDKESHISGSVVPVGYAVQNKEVVLLGEDGQEVGCNETGEIAVRSRYLAVGYWRRPDLTRAKYLPDPNGGDERVYLTGDLGRMLPDGCLEYLGRKDLQVKIRGYRVEVTEIETLLLELPAVKEAAVVARGDVGNEKQLVAYIVATHDPVPSISELRRSLRQKLPDYMVPSNFVVMDALPLTLNGKLDRRALPEPGKSRPDLDAPFVAPRTPVEEQLAQIWAEVLDLDQVGIHDNFLDLGGNSLMATQVISRVRDAFQVELPLRSLFETPTVADLAVAIVQTQADEETARLLREMDVISDQEAQRRLAQTMQGKES